MEDERHPDWVVVVKTKPRKVFDLGQGEVNNDDDRNYHENEPFNLNINHDSNEVDDDFVQCTRNDMPAFKKTRRMYDINLILHITYCMFISSLCMILALPLVLTILIC